MKWLILPAIGAFALLGCQDQQLTRSARWSVDNMSYASAGYGGWEYGNLQRGMIRRQRQWDYYNRYQWGTRPGWNARPCLPSAKLDPCRINRRGRSPAVMLAPQMNAPALSREDKQAYAQIGKAYGISIKASVALLESLNRAAVGDFGGLKGLGLSSARLASAQRNRGRLDPDGLNELSRALGASPQQTDALIQSIFGKR